MDSKIVETAVKVASSVDNKHAEQVKSPTEPAVRKSMKEEKSRKKDDKSVEQVLKALNSLETTEEKLAAMCKKYSDIVDENRKLQLTMKQAEKRFSMVQREKEQLQTEHSKAVLTRSRLESLCRELQRQNKAIKDESLLKIREEEEKRKEVSAKFQSTLNEITALMQQNNEKNSKLREDNLEMTKKFKTVCEQYELREQQVEKISKQMQLETQLADAKLAKARMEFVAEKEILLKEKQHLLTDLSEYKAKYQELQQTEVNLRSQISLYTDKYDEFQNALSRSNEVFGGFKGEMEKMSKKICKLEKETSSWKQRWEKSHQALLEMAADKQQRDSELALANRQLAQLQKLCRTLQAERTSLLAQLRTEGANRVTETAGKEDIPLGTLQSLQDAMPCPLNSSNLELCCEEAEKKVISTENSPDTNKLLSDLIRNVSALQVNPEQNSTGETPPVIEAIVEPVGTITNEQTVCSQTEQTMPMQNQDNLIEAPAPESPKVESGYSTAVSSEIQADQNSSLSNDHISTKEACPGSLINGQIPLHEFSDRSVKIEEISPEAKSIESVNSSHNTPNGIIEPVAEKTSPTETKKGKDGGKKRKNK